MKTAPHPIRIHSNGPLLFDRENFTFPDELTLDETRKLIVVHYAGTSIEIDVNLEDPSYHNILFEQPLSKIEAKKDKIYFKIYDEHRVDVTNMHIKVTQDKRQIFFQNSPDNNYYIVNFHDALTDTLVSSYFLSRKPLPLYLEHIQVIHKDFHDDPKASSKKKVIETIKGPYNSPLIDRVFRIPSKEAIQLTFAKPKEYKYPVYWMYELISDRTSEKKTSKSTDGKITLDGLRPGESYTLIVWYPFQMEPSFQKQYRLMVTRLWYQSPIFHFSLILAIMTSLIAYVIYRFVRKQKNLIRQQEQVEQQLLSIQSQLNPHFLFNSLNSIMGLNNNGDTEKANQYLQEFSLLLRATLNNSDKVAIPLEKELNSLRTYLQLEQLRFGFKWDIVIDDGINTSEVNIPTLILQPLVENAIKHGVAGLGKKGTIGIQVLKQESDILIRIEDNGPGFTGNDKEGHGLKLTKNRIKLYNRLDTSTSIHLNMSFNEGIKTTVLLKNWMSN